MTQKAVCSITSQGTNLGCGFDPGSEHVRGAADRCLPLSLFLSLFPSSSLSKVSKKHISLGED